MKLGISSLSTGKLKITEALTEARKLDVSLVEIFGDFLFYGNTPYQEEPKEIKLVKDNEGMDLTIHLPALDLNSGSLNDGIYNLTREEILVALEFASEVGAKLAVFHPAYSPISFEPILFEVKERMEKLLRELVEITSKQGIILALENLGVENTWVINKPEKMKQIVLDFSSKLKVTYDFGHGFIAKDIKESLNLLKDDIVHLHLHDNHGFADEHLPIGEGLIPYEDYRDFFREFKGTAVLEVFSFKDPIREIKESIVKLKEIVGHNIT